MFQHYKADRIRDTESSCVPKSFQSELESESELPFLLPVLFFGLMPRMDCKQSKQIN